MMEIKDYVQNTVKVKKVEILRFFSSPEPLGSLVFLWYRHALSSVPPSTIFKDLLLQNHWAIRSQISCGASMGRGNENLLGAFGSHDQDGRHAHMVKTLQKSSLEPKGQWSWALVCSIGPIKVCSNDDVGLALLFYGKVKFGPLCFYMGKTVRKVV